MNRARERPSAKADDGRVRSGSPDVEAEITCLLAWSNDQSGSSSHPRGAGGDARRGAVGPRDGAVAARHALGATLWKRYAKPQYTSDCLPAKLPAWLTSRRPRRRRSSASASTAGPSRDQANAENSRHQRSPTNTQTLVYRPFAPYRHHPPSPRPPLQAGGRRFDPGWLHDSKSIRTADTVGMLS